MFYISTNKWLANSLKKRNIKAYFFFNFFVSSYIYFLNLKSNLFSNIFPLKKKLYKNNKKPTLPSNPRLSFYIPIFKNFIFPKINIPITTLTVGIYIKLMNLGIICLYSENDIYQIEQIQILLKIIFSKLLFTINQIQEYYENRFYT